MTLVGATVASVWDDIFHHPDDEAVLDNTLACVRWMHSEWDGVSGWMGFPEGMGCGLQGVAVEASIRGFKIDDTKCSII